MMARTATTVLLFFLMAGIPVKVLHAQETDPYQILGKLKERYASIKSYSVNIEITVDVDFIKMPVKHAQLFYKQPDKISFKSSDFIMVPKRGFQNAVSELLGSPYIAMNTGIEKIGNRDQYVIKIIPSGKKSDIILATWWIDVERGILTRTESNTRDQGTFTVDLKYYNASDLLPYAIIISFEIEGLSLPLKFIGKSNGMTIDKQKMNGKQTGRVIIRFSGYQVNT
jgi:hypothetical protein